MSESSQDIYPRQAEVSLVSAAVGGDIDAFAHLVRIYTNAVCAIAYDILRDYHLAQDIAQETFVRAYRSLPTLQNQVKFGSWLYSIATNLSIDQQRSRARTSRLQDELESIAVTGLEIQADDRLIQQEMRLDIRRSLDRLDATSRTILLSFYVNEMTMPQIAQMLDLSVSAVESRLRRGRKVLKASHLSAWVGRYGSRKASDRLVAQVMERIITKTGQFYIPVTDKNRMADWFVTILGLSLNHNGHIILPSDHTLFLIEVSDAVLAERSKTTQPVLIFSVEDTNAFYQAIIGKGVRAIREKNPGIAGEIFFFDPDGNCYGALAP